MWCWKIVSGGVIYLISLCIFYHFRGRDASREEGMVLGNFEIGINLVGKKKNSHRDEVEVTIRRYLQG